MRSVVSEVGGPGLTNPFAGPGVIRQAQLVVCGNTYQEGAPEIVEECNCGTFAIGRCVDCRQPVCGVHSALWEGRRLCMSHVHEAHATAESQRRESLARGVAGMIATSIRAWDEWLAAARSALAESSDPTERVVRVVAGLSPGSRVDARNDDPQLLLDLLLPEQIARREPGSRWWWDHDAVQEWFLRAVVAPPRQLGVVRFRRTLLGGTRRKQTTAPGWTFQGGSTVSRGEPGTPTHCWLDVTVLADGRRLLGANADAGGNVGFNASALVLMAERAELQLLPPFPSVGFSHPQTGERIWPAA